MRTMRTIYNIPPCSLNFNVSLMRTIDNWTWPLSRCLSSQLAKNLIFHLQVAVVTTEEEPCGSTCGRTWCTTWPGGYRPPTGSKCEFSASISNTRSHISTPTLHWYHMMGQIIADCYVIIMRKVIRLICHADEGKNALQCGLQWSLFYILFDITVFKVTFNRLLQKQDGA